jgi:hypothetical protein
MGQPVIYTVVLRCQQSMLRFPANGAIRLAPLHTPSGELAAYFATRGEKVPHIDTPIPREPWIEIVGPAQDLDDAISTASSVTDHFVRLIGFAANAWPGRVVPHIAFVSQVGIAERDFFQNFIVDEQGLPRPMRLVDTALAVAIIEALNMVRADWRPRLHRAIAQYTDALDSWKPGHEILALSRLYMGVEAVTKVASELEAERRGYASTAELETAVLPPRPDGQKRPNSQTLESWTRENVIFRGDKETYRTAKASSDQFEHGFESFDAIYPNAKACLEKVAAYLRQAIIECLPLSAETRGSLLGGTFEKPARNSGYERHIVAKLVAPTDELAANDEAYPQCLWKFDLQGFSIAESGGFEMQVTQSITPRLAAGVQITLSRISLQGPAGSSNSKPEISITKAAEEKAGVLMAVDSPTTAGWAQPVGAFLLNINSMRALALFWLARLTGSARGKLSGIPLLRAVEGIDAAIVACGVPETLRQRCADAWRKVVEYDALRMSLAEAVTLPGGLVLLGEEQEGSAPSISDPSKLADLNKAAIDVANDLHRLLDEVLATGKFPQPAEQV